MASESIDAIDALKGLLDVAKVALVAGPEISQEETTELLLRLLAVVERSMPPELQKQDIRIIRAKLVLDSLLDG